MSTNIKIPKLGMSMDEAKLVEWLAEDGAHVEAGAPLYEIETDKATQEVEAPVSGTLKIVAEKGETYEVGHLIATIEEA
jgi:pyruvate/2-oxoglutarate dehydrogenase complex dihydrolipoamide acyltransferase (E2) component